jgi:uncharacterized membrane protein
MTRAVVRAGSVGDVLDRLELTEATPPLYYYATWAWGRLFGGLGSDAGLRATSTVASCASVPLAFAAFRRLIGDLPALATSALVAASPVLVAYALNARAYSFLVLLSLASIWAMARVLERPVAGRWLLWAVAAAAAMWTHYFGAFLVVAEVGVLALRFRDKLARTLGWTALSAALAAPLLPLLASQGDDRSEHIGELALSDRIEQAVRQFGMGPNVPRAWLEAIGLALAAGGLAGGLVAARRRRGALVPAGLAAVAIALPLVLSLTDVVDRFFMRNLLMAWACVAAVAALGLLRLRALPLAAYLAVCLAAILWVHGDWRYRNADWHGAVRTLGGRAEGAPVVVLPGFEAPTANVYLGRPVAGAPLRATRAWVLVSPGRIERRALRALDGYPRRLPAGFTVGPPLSYRGFRLIELRAARPTPLRAADFGPDVLGQPPVLLRP